MAAKKKLIESEKASGDRVITTATHEIRTDEQGSLVSCIELSSGDEVAVPLEHRFLTN